MILGRYNIERDRMRFPWGTSQRYYNWVPKLWPTADTGLTAYMLAPESHWVCCEGSLGLASDGELVKDGINIGAYLYSDHLLEDYPKRAFRVEKGGV
jgi:hypothetical protein